MNIIGSLMIVASLLIASSSSCQIFETKRTCECKARYTMGVDDLVEKKLFEVPSRDFCLTGVSCEKLLYKECAEYCMKTIKKILGDQEDNVWISGTNTICKSIVSPNVPVTSKDRIKVVSRYEFLGCQADPDSSGVEVVVDNVCCYQKCTCSMFAQKVVTQIQTGAGTVDRTPVQTLPISYENESYQCSMNELDECEKKCKAALAIYLGRNDIDQLDFAKRRNLNIISTHENSREKVCQDAQKDQMTKQPMPIDVYLELDDMLNTALSRRVYTLGRVCCYQKCDCKWNIYEVVSDLTQGFMKLATTSPLTSNVQLSAGYECSSELNRCMQNCRDRVQAIVMATSPQLVKPELSLQENDLLQSDELALHVCRYLKDYKPTTNSLSLINGYHVYVVYSNQEATTYAHREDMYVGRVCCQINGQSISASSRC